MYFAKCGYRPPMSLMCVNNIPHSHITRPRTLSKTLTYTNTCWTTGACFSKEHTTGHLDWSNSVTREVISFGRGFITAGTPATLPLRSCLAPRRAKVDIGRRVRVVYVEGWRICQEIFVSPRRSKLGFSSARILWFH